MKCALEHANGDYFHSVCSFGCSTLAGVHSVVHDRAFEEKTEYRKIANYEFNIKTEMGKMGCLKSNVQTKNGDECTFRLRGFPEIFLCHYPNLRNFKFHLKSLILEKVSGNSLESFPKVCLYGLRLLPNRLLVEDSKVLMT